MGTCLAFPVIKAMSQTNVKALFAAIELAKNEN